MTWSLTVYQVAEPVINPRSVDIFFAPDDIDNTHMSCLEMEFTSSRHFDVKLLYADSANLNSQYQEVLIYRTMSALDSQLRVWSTRVRPELTENQAFYVLVHVESTSPGELATIRRLKLKQGDCHKDNMDQSEFPSGKKSVQNILVLSRFLTHMAFIRSKSTACFFAHPVYVADNKLMTRRWELTMCVATPIHWYATNSLQPRMKQV